jgi:micrococcal nuclease
MRLRMSTAWALCLLLPLAGLSAPPKPAALQGAVTQVIDGGSVRFAAPGQPAITVRVRDIEPPEPCQPWAAEARAALVALALNKPATMLPSGRDAQGHTVGALLVDEVNIGQRMVEEGHAWSVRGRNDRGPYIKQERMAKALGRGLHGAPGAVMPREWRRTKPCAPPA